MPTETAATLRRMGSLGELLRAAHGADRERERHPAAGDGRGARAAVGLDDVAVERDGALPERAQVDRGAQRAADEPLDLEGAAALLARAPPRAPCARCVERGSIPYSAVTQPAPVPKTCGGTFSSIEAVQRTWVSPKRARQEPSACFEHAGLEDDRAEVALGRGRCVGHGGADSTRRARRATAAARRGSRTADPTGSPAAPRARKARIPSDDRLGDLLRYSRVRSLAASAGCEMKPTSSSTAGMRAPAST